jgi:hypothetical protein
VNATDGAFKKNIEICGLCKPDNGRSCDSHDICGSTAELGTTVTFEYVTVEIQSAEGSIEKQGLAVVSMRNGCRIGFVSHVFQLYWHAISGRVGVITELWADSVNKSMRLRSHRFAGVGIVSVVVDKLEWKAAISDDSSSGEEGAAPTAKNKRRCGKCGNPGHDRRSCPD